MRAKPRRWQLPALGRVAASVLLLSLCADFGWVETSAAQETPSQVPAAEADVAVSDEARIPIAVLPFRIHSARPLGYLTESLSDLLATRLEATGKVTVVSTQSVSDTLRAPGGGSDVVVSGVLFSLRPGWRLS